VLGLGTSVVLWQCASRRSFTEVNCDKMHTEMSGMFFDLDAVGVHDARETKERLPSLYAPTCGMVLVFFRNKSAINLFVDRN
jgi:hypothetical protein